MYLYRKLFIIAALCFFPLVVAMAADTTDATNDFYDNEKLYDLQGDKITVEGEIVNPGAVDFTKLPMRTVIVKEAVLKGDTGSFIGAYRYDGYSLYDILNSRIKKKKNDKEFSSIIDLYVIVENKDGEKVVFTWGEIYYPVNRFQNIIAHKVMRIVPSLTKDLWPLPTEAKLVAAQDLITERNIKNPVKIIVCSSPKSFIVKKGMKPLYSDSIAVCNGDSVIATLSELPTEKKEETYRSVFYGRGKGIHGISTFKGVPFQNILLPWFKVNQQNLKQGLFVVAGKDGYRATFTFSELFNRNDQSETLLIDLGKKVEGGRFKLFAAGDFFSDRAIKGISQVYFITCK